MRVSVDEREALSTVHIGTGRHPVAVRWADHPRGGGTPVVLLHGMAVDTSHLVPTLARVARSRTVAAPDLPGFGRSPNTGPPITVRDAAETLRAVIAELTGPAVVVGHSAGCQAAVELAVRHPESVRRLVLVSPPPGRRNPLAVAARWVQAMTREPAPLARATLRDAAAAGARNVWGAFRNLRTYRLRGVLHLVGCPVLVVRGEHDPLVPLAAAWHLTDIARHGRFAEVPGCHAVPYTSPDALARVILGTDGAPDDPSTTAGGPRPSLEPGV